MDSNKKNYSYLLLIASILASLVGILVFIYLFVLDFNIYWFIFWPMIFALYQSPAVYLFWLWKKQKR
ncbi:MAG: hypothetical protein E3J44_04985, partial [Candidatus Aminicenantes bacterium]